MIFMPLNTLTMASIPPQVRADASGLYNLTRQLGGSAGIAASATLITSFSKEKYAALTEHIAGNSLLGLERLAALKARLLTLGTPEVLADIKAKALLNSQILKQAQMLSFAQLFLLFGLAMLIVVLRCWR